LETTNNYQIESVIRALDILELLAANGGTGRITDIAREMGCSKNTTFRLLQTLQARGFVRQADDSSYELTFKLLKLGESVLRTTEIPDVARPYLHSLAQTLGETSTLAFLDGDGIVYIDRVYGNMPHNTSYTIGSRAKARSTALGKAMLAYSPATIVENILSQGLSANTPYTITDPDQFRAELKHIAQGNCAIDNQENVLGIRCIAAPIFNRKGEVVAALSISGLAVRLTDERLDEFSTHVMGAAKAISERLGYEG
jgi:DNA-binding IclR family transcriptional regulator